MRCYACLLCGEEVPHDAMYRHLLLEHPPVHRGRAEFGVRPCVKSSSS